MRRLGVWAISALVLTVCGASVAWASARLDKASVPGNTDVDLILEVTVEELVGYNDKIVATVPDGFRVLSCAAPEGYTCAAASAANPPRTLLTWDNTTPSPQEFGITPTIRFPFRLRTTAVAGDYRFVVEQTYSNGAVSRWDGPEGSANPAPVLRVTSSSVDPAPSPPATTPSERAEPAPPPPPPASSPPFDFGNTTTDPFENETTPAPSDAPATPTTTETTAPSPPGLLAAEVTTSGDGGGIRGLERVVLLGLAALAVGAAAFSGIRQRAS